MNRHDAPLWQSAANDRAPRARKSPVTRFADAIGLAMMILYSLSFGGLLLALSYDVPRAELLFIGTMVPCAVTLILASMFERKLGG